MQKYEMKLVWDVLFHGNSAIFWKIENLTAKQNKSSDGISEKLVDSDNETTIQDLRRGINRNREQLNTQIKQTTSLFKEAFNLIETQKTDLILLTEKKIQDTNLKPKIQQEIIRNYVSKFFTLTLYIFLNSDFVKYAGFVDDTFGTSFQARVEEKGSDICTPDVTGIALI